MGLMDRIFMKPGKKKGEYLIEKDGFPPMSKMYAAGAQAEREPGKVEIDPILRVEEAGRIAETRARELRAREESMPSLEDAAENEKAEVLRLDAESDAWSRIAGVFSRTSSEQDGSARLARLRNELAVLKATNLDKGPEAEVIKLEAIEEIERTLGA
jgi:hypothetical protein